MDGPSQARPTRGTMDDPSPAPPTRGTVDGPSPASPTRGTTDESSPTPPARGFMEPLSAMGGPGSGAMEALAPGAPVHGSMEALAQRGPVRGAKAAVQPDPVRKWPADIGVGDGCTTPRKNTILSTSHSLFVPVCDDELRPVVGMSFDSLEAIEAFYKTYAHEGGFAVRIGPQIKVRDVVTNKRFLCTRQGFRRKKGNIAPSGKQKKTKMQLETRCGCDAHIYVKLGRENKYYIASVVEQHNHGLVSPNKISFLSSIRSVSQRVKTNIFSHEASIGTSQVYRLPKVSDGFENIGCMKRDLQNYCRGLREKIKNKDAQLFVEIMEGKKEANSAFFYDFVVDDQGKLIYIFWADATSRKNYSYFGDVVTFDATYNTNQYNMKFASFTGVNHHMQSVFLSGAFIVNEKVESYEWLFKTFLSAMGGKAPRLIITDEDASMKSVIGSCFPGTIHRFCMQRIMEKMPEKIGHPTNRDQQFWSDLSKCVWNSETGEEFEMWWNDIITDHGLQGNDWLASMYQIRESWIPAYFMDIPLAGLLRTTSRSESSNSFFNLFIHRKLGFVEFWLRFNTTLESQRYKELKADSIHSKPLLSTPWPMEKQVSILYTHNVFEIFQKEVLAARDHCIVVQIVEQEGVKVVIVNDGSMRERVVQWNKSNIFGSCSCKLFERMGIPCRHIILTLRGEKLYELPSSYILKRWETKYKREKQFDEECNLLEKPIDAIEVERMKKIAAVRNKVEDLIQRARNSNKGIDFLVTSVMNIETSFGQIVPSTVPATQQEYESFSGWKIPKQVEIHSPTYVRSNGRSKRIKRANELPKPQKGKDAKNVMKEPPL